jgi:hypothetical protein
MIEWLNSPSAPVWIMYAAFVVCALFLWIEAHGHEQTIKLLEAECKRFEATLERIKAENDLDFIAERVEHVLELMDTEPKAARHEAERLLEAIPA